MIIREAPVLVKRPSPSSASGQIPAQVSEFERPRSVMHQSEMSAFNPKSTILPGMNSTPSVATTPSTVQSRSAVTCETYRGMRVSPKR